MKSVAGETLRMDPDQGGRGPSEISLDESDCFLTIEPVLESVKIKITIASR
jgi:hypothetical protein